MRCDVLPHSDASTVILGYGKVEMATTTRFLPSKMRHANVNRDVGMSSGIRNDQKPFALYRSV